MFVFCIVSWIKCLHGHFRTEPMIKDLLALAKYLPGHSEQQQMSAYLNSLLPFVSVPNLLCLLLKMMHVIAFTVHPDKPGKYFHLKTLYLITPAKSLPYTIYRFQGLGADRVIQI